MKKSLFSALIISGFLLSACDDKTTNVQSETQSDTPTVQQEKPNTLEAKSGITLLEKGDAPTADRLFNPEKPVYLNIQTVETKYPWLNNLLNFNISQQVLGSRKNKLSIDMPDLKTAFITQLESLYPELEEKLKKEWEAKAYFEKQILKLPTDSTDEMSKEDAIPSHIYGYYYIYLANFLAEHNNIATFDFLVLQNPKDDNSYNYFVRNIDLERKSIIKVRDLIDEKNIPALAQLLQSEIYSRVGKVIEIEDIPIESSSFRFYKEGIVFQYPAQYTIAEFDMNLSLYVRVPPLISPVATIKWVDLFVKWDQIQPLLSESYKDLPQYDFEPILEDDELEDDE